MTRVTDSPHWRWMSGMSDSDGRCVLAVHGQNVYWEWARGADPTAPERPMTRCGDGPATAGCLLALVREAWGEPELIAMPACRDDSWIVVEADLVWWSESFACTDIKGSGPTEIDALKAALLAAPVKS